MRGSTGDDVREFPTAIVLAVAFDMNIPPKGLDGRQSLALIRQLIGFLTRQDPNSLAGLDHSGSFTGCDRLLMYQLPWLEQVGRPSEGTDAAIAWRDAVVMARGATCQVTRA